MAVVVSESMSGIRGHSLSQSKACKFSKTYLEWVNNSKAIVILNLPDRAFESACDTTQERVP